jgi:hypothetical protein
VFLCVPPCRDGHAAEGPTLGSFGPQARRAGSGQEICHSSGDCRLKNVDLNVSNILARNPISVQVTHISQQSGEDGKLIQYPMTGNSLKVSMT